ncbi:MAG: hypothetical protein NVSMB23_24210 [Myxococcales bacterium]
MGIGGVAHDAAQSKAARQAGLAMRRTLADASAGVRGATRGASAEWFPREPARSGFREPMG